MKKSKSLFSQLHKKVIFYGLVDEGGWFPQMLASRKTTAEYTKLTKILLRNLRHQRQKNSVNLCESVSNFSYFAQYDIRITQYGSIKIEQLCKTNPISQQPKMLVTAVYTMTNNKKL
jgi:hypothetical protein